MDEMVYFDRLPIYDRNRSSFNHPSQELLDGARMSDYMRICVPLYKALIKGDYFAVRNILRRNHERTLRLSITHNLDKVLHVAATSRSFVLVEYLIGKMADDDLLLQNAQGYTALSIVARHGDIRMAQLLVTRCSGLLIIRGKGNIMPLHIAAMCARPEMVACLYNLNDWTNEEKRLLFSVCIELDLF